MKLRSLACIMAILALFGCNKIEQIEDIEVESSNSEFAVPLVNAKFSLQKLLDNSGDLAVITVEPNGCIRLTYEGEVLRAGAEVMTEAINEVLPLGSAVPVLDNTMVLPFAIPGEYEFDFIRLKDGNLFYAFDISNGAEFDLELKFPNFLLNGEPITYNIDVNGNNTYTNFFFPTNLEGAVIEAEEDGTLLVEYTATDSDGNPVNMDGQILFTITEDLQFDYLEGYFGGSIFDSAPGEIVIDFFDDFVSGNVYFEEPTVSMTISNSFGMPVRTKSEYFEVVNVDGDVLPLTSEDLGPDLELDFNYPSLEEVGETKETTFVFNNENSNIAEILGSGPTVIRYDVDAVPNPDSDTDIRGFISCESAYVVNIKADLPIYGRANGFIANDVFDLDFSGYDDIKSAEFKIVTENELPLDVDMQIYFARADSTVIDSLFPEMTPIAASPAIDENGISIDSAKEEFFAPIDAERFRNIADNSKKILVRTSFSTTDNGSTSVKVLADQEVEIRMGMKIVRE